MKAYVLNLSPLKTSKNAKPYFNMSLETEDKAVKRAVCYSYRKRRLFEEAQLKGMRVHIENAGTYDDGTIKISDHCLVKHEVLLNQILTLKPPPWQVSLMRYPKTPL